MSQSNVLYTMKDHGPMVQAYANLQMDYLSSSCHSPSIIEIDLAKEQGAYVASLLFFCADFSFTILNRSWSPYKAIEGATVLAKEEIMLRTYDSYTYA